MGILKVRAAGMMDKPGSMLGCFAMVLVFNVVVGGWLTQYVFEFWLTYVKGVAIHLPFWACALAGLFLGQFMVPAAIITLLLSFAL